MSKFKNNCFASQKSRSFILNKQHACYPFWRVGRRMSWCSFSELLKKAWEELKEFSTNLTILEQRALASISERCSVSKFREKDVFLKPWTFSSMLNKAVKSSMATMAHTTALLKSSFNHFNTDEKNITVPLKSHKRATADREENERIIFKRKAFL